RDAHPARARGRPAARPRGRRAAPRRRAVERRRGPPQAQRGPARGMGVQLRPQRRGGRARDRADRRRAGRYRRARPTGVSPRKRLLRWLGWFAVVNAALLGIIGLRYLWLYAALGRTVSWSYALVASVGHLSALACDPLLVLLVPVATLIPRARLVLPLGVVLASAGVAVLVLDSLVFAENRYHLNVLTFTLLEPQTWAFLALYFFVALAIEAMLAAWIWRRTARPPTRRIGWSVGLALGACFVAGHIVHAWAEAHYDMSVTAFTRYLPLYHPLRNPGLLARLGLIDRMRARERGVGAALDRRTAGELNYPLAPMRCEARAPRLNVLLVVIDALRADALTPEVAPRLSELARGAMQFDRHYPGGTGSRPGMFSLFYAIPATYFD